MSTEAFELPPKRPKHTKLEKLDNKSTAKLLRKNSKQYNKEERIGQKRGNDDLRRVPEMHTENSGSII